MHFTTEPKDMKSIINLRNLEFVEHRHGEQYQAETAAVANKIGADKLGFRVTRLPPGKAAWPFHAHYANEEMFYILAGHGELRFGKERHAIEAGDFISAPADPTNGHQILNTSASTLEYICVSTMISPEVAIFPESGKLSVFANGAPGRTEDNTLVKHFANDQDQPYWTGE